MSAPPALSVRMRFAVSVVTCRHADTRQPASGRSRSKRSRIAARTGMCRSAHSMRRTPSGASARSRTSNRLVVAMSPLFPSSSGEQPLVLALLPFERPEPDDVLDLRRGHLDDEGVLVSLQAMNRAREEAEAVTGVDVLRRTAVLPHGAHLERRPALVHVPGLVLVLVVLERERLPGAHEEQLAAVRVRQSPDQLVAPGLLDAPGLERELAHAVPPTASQSGWAATCSSARRR